MADKLENLNQLAAKTTKIEEKGKGLGDRAKAAFLVAIAVGAVAMGIGNAVQNSFDPMTAAANISTCQNAMVNQLKTVECMAADLGAQFEISLSSYDGQNMSMQEFGTSFRTNPFIFSTEKAQETRDALRDNLLQVAEQAMAGKTGVESYEAAASAMTERVQAIYNQTMSLENAEKVIESEANYAFKEGVDSLVFYAYGDGQDVGLDTYTQLAYDHMIGDGGFGDAFINHHGGINGAAKELKANNANPESVIEVVKDSNAMNYRVLNNMGTAKDLLSKITQHQQDFSASPDGMKATFEIRGSSFSSYVSLYNKDSHSTLEGTGNSSKLNNLFSDKVQTGAEKAAKDFSNRMEAQKSRIFTSVMG